MEAPIPISMATPGLITKELNNKISENKNEDKPKENDNNASLIKITEYKLEYKNKNYIIKLSMTSDKQYFNIQTKEEGNVSYYFESQMKLEELMKFDKIFRTCDDIEEALVSFNSIFTSEKNLIKDVNNNKLTLLINIRQLDGSFRAKDLELLKKSLNKDVIIDNLSIQIDELKENNNKLLNEINTIKSENNNLKNAFDEMENWKTELIKEISELKNKVDSYELKLFKIDSNIITNKKDYDFIIERLKKVYSEKESIMIELNLLYRATRDGDDASDFHLKCDKFKNTLVIVKTKKGLRFGGFTSESWGGNGDIKDKNAFCFSLDKMKIYNNKKGKTAIFAHPNSGPAFENCIFEVKDKCFKVGGLCNNNNFYDNQETDYEINDGDEQFEVQNVEVFGVTFYFFIIFKIIDFFIM